MSPATTLRATVRLQLPLDNEARQPTPGAAYQVAVRLNGQADNAEEVGGAFRAAFDLDILRGSVRRLPDGGAVYRFTLDQARGDEWRRRLTQAALPPITDN